MTVVLAAGVAAVSAFLLDRFRIPTHVGRVISRASHCRQLFADPTLSDLEKERGLREQSVRLFGLFVRIAGGSAVAIGAPLAAVVGLQAAGVTSASAVVATLISPGFLVAAFSVGGALWAARRQAAK